MLTMSILLEMHQLIPDMIHVHCPLPELPSTFTLYSHAAGATPIIPVPFAAAAIIPAACVPWAPDLRSELGSPSGHGLHSEAHRGVAQD